MRDSFIPNCSFSLLVNQQTFEDYPPNSSQMMIWGPLGVLKTLLGYPSGWNYFITLLMDYSSLLLLFSNECLVEVSRGCSHEQHSRLKAGPGMKIPGLSLSQRARRFTKKCKTRPSSSLHFLGFGKHSHFFHKSKPMLTSIRFIIILNEHLYLLT